MAKGEICRITNCTNKITHKGTVCGTHKWRMKKFNSYDLPGYIGIPNTYEPFPELPTGIVKKCDIHGHLTENEVYNRYYKNHISSRYCKKCLLNKAVTKKYKEINNEEDYQNIFNSQNGVCAICKREETMLSNNKITIKKLSVDHCHQSGKVRGLLCCACNTAIGYFKEDIHLLESAIEYLKKSKD